MVSLLCVALWTHALYAEGRLPRWSGIEDLDAPTTSSLVLVRDHDGFNRYLRQQSLLIYVQTSWRILKNFGASSVAFIRTLSSADVNCLSIISRLQTLGE